MGEDKGRRLVRTLLSTLLAAVILHYLGRSLARSWREAGVYHWSIDVPWLALSILLLALYFFLAPWLWKRVLRELGEEIGTGEACRVWYLSQLGKYVPGKIWFALGRIYLARRSGVSAVAASVSTILELMLVILAALGVFMLSLPFWPSALWAETFLVPLAVGVLLLLVHPRIFGVLLRLALRALRREPVTYRLTWAGLLTIAAGYAVTWLVYGAGIEVLLRAVRLEGAIVPDGRGTFARVLFFSGAAGVAWAIGFLSFFTPSGLGVREATLSYLLASQLPAPWPILLALAARIWMTFGEIGGAIAGGLLGRRRHEG